MPFQGNAFSKERFMSWKEMKGELEAEMNAEPRPVGDDPHDTSAPFASPATPAPQARKVRGSHSTGVAPEMPCKALAREPQALLGYSRRTLKKPSTCINVKCKCRGALAENV